MNCMNNKHNNQMFCATFNGQRVTGTIYESSTHLYLRCIIKSRVSGNINKSTRRVRIYLTPRLFDQIVLSRQPFYVNIHSEKDGIDWLGSGYMSNLKIINNLYEL